MNNKAGSNEKLDKFVKLNLSLTDIENSKIRIMVISVKMILLILPLLISVNWFY